MPLAHSRPLDRLYPRHSRLSQAGHPFPRHHAAVGRPRGLPPGDRWRWPSRSAAQQIDLVAAAEARGFIFAAPLAIALGAGLVPIRKPGKLPCKTLSHTYELEYGTDTLQVHADAVLPGANVLMVDDLLATGGTIEACCRMIEQAGGRVVGCAFLIELAGLGGAARIAQYKTVSLIRYP